MMIVMVNTLKHQLQHTLVRTLENDTAIAMDLVEWTERAHIIFTHRQIDKPTTVNYSLVSA